MRTILLFFLVLAACSTGLSAQRATYRVRLYEPWSLRLSPEIRTPLDSLRPDSLRLTIAHDSTVMVPMMYVSRIDSLARVVPRGQRVRHSAISGVIVGGIAGVALGFLAYSQSAHGSLNSRPANMAAAGVGFGAFGGVLGMVIGSASSGEEWKPLWPRP